MSIRTDLAIELSENANGKLKGVEKNVFKTENITTTEIKILSPEGEKEIGRKIGKYITVEFPSVFSITDFSPLKAAIINALKELSANLKREKILVAGLGNTDITPDAVGPFCAKGLLATRHIVGSFAENIGLKGLKEVSVISPGVLGQTGIETTELLKGAVNSVKPDIVIVIDALAAKSSDRLYKTVQLTDTGIYPGSGVKNSRKEISEATLGTKVLAVGVPTVVDVFTLAFELTGNEPKDGTDMFVTPKDVDILTKKLSEVLSSAINEFLQPEIEPQIISSLV